MSDEKKIQTNWRRSTIGRLRRRNDHLEEENRYLKHELLSPEREIPAHVKEWMKEFDLLCWEAFWRFEHEAWFEVLDHCFPYHIEDCACAQC